VVLDREPGWLHGRRRRDTPRVPFYERVNRFVFGPPRPPRDLRAEERAILAETRRLAGRIGPLDVLRVAETTREEAEARLCRMVVDYDGEIDVSEEGAVVYRFPGLRRTAGERAAPDVVPPVWERPARVRPLTGNGAGTNVLLGAINTLNLGASGFVLANGEAFAAFSDALVWGLGVVPFTFSAAVFALPALRVFARRREARAVAYENGRRGLLRRLASGTDGPTITAAELAAAWVSAGGGEVEERRLTEAMRALGAEPDVDERGRLVFRVEELSRERRSLEAARRLAPVQERSPGETVFSSDSGDTSSSGG
jgi:hypothetical protein